MLGMFALGVSLLYGAAIAASLGVLLVLAASLTLLPALLMITGNRVGRVRVRRGRADKAGRLGFWPRWVGFIQRRPALTAIASTVLLLLLAAPALGLRMGSSDAGTNPPNTTTRKAYDLLAAGFGRGFNGPLLLAVRLPAAGDTAALATYTTTLQDTAGISSSRSRASTRPPTPRRSPSTRRPRRRAPRPRAWSSTCAPTCCPG
jgi:RND superfamily putative drug exporter